MKLNFLNLRLLGCLLFISLLLGCQTNYYEPEENEIFEEEIGAYSFGPVVENGVQEEMLQFEYSGEEVRIHYYVQGWAEGISSKFGWFLFVDGVLQPTRLETLDGQILKEEAYIHEFALAFLEMYEFHVVFTPNSGAMGQQVGLIGATILRPTFMPEGVERPYFQIFHSLATTLPAELLINSEISNHFLAYTNVDFINIPEELFEELKYFSGILEQDELLELLIHHPDFRLLGNRDHDSIIYVEDGKINFELQFLGGKEVTSRITIFVNHEPVQVNGSDFIELTMEQGKIATVQVEVEIEDLDELNSIYAVVMTTGDDYHVQDIFKTRTLLLVNE